MASLAKVAPYFSESTHAMDSGMRQPAVAALTDQRAAQTHASQLTARRRCDAQSTSASSENSERTVLQRCRLAAALALIFTAPCADSSSNVPPVRVTRRSESSVSPSSGNRSAPAADFSDVSAEGAASVAAEKLPSSSVFDVTPAVSVA